MVITKSLKQVLIIKNTKFDKINYSVISTYAYHHQKKFNSQREKILEIRAVIVIGSEPNLS
jgi:hypothetical protein